MVTEGKQFALQTYIEKNLNKVVYLAVEERKYLREPQILFMKQIHKYL